LLTIPLTASNIISMITMSFSVDEHTLKYIEQFQLEHNVSRSKALRMIVQRYQLAKDELDQSVSKG
jgi:hypothetical protein